jgi:type III secretion protein W
MQDNFSTSPIEPTDSSRIQKQQQAEAKRISIAQEASQIAMTEFGNEAAFNPVTMSKRFKTLEEKRRKDLDKKETVRSDDSSFIVEEVEEIANEFEKRNTELNSRSLQQLLTRLGINDNAEQILQKALENYNDQSLADEALEFLDQATKGAMQKKIRNARENFNEAFGREIRAGRNITQQAQAFSKEGLGSATGLRDLYREITGNPRPASTLFNELSQKFNFANLKTAIDFLLHSMGADLKSHGPSIPSGRLHALMSEARNLLAILWVYRFFLGRMDLINASFQRNGVLLPSQITFEMLAKLFVSFLMERYPSMDKVFQLALKLGISADVLAQIIIFNQMRDAVRGVAPKLYRNEQHRHDVLMSFIEALEELEEQIEEEDEGDEEEEEG